jgi:hypothetical protein
MGLQTCCRHVGSIRWKMRSFWMSRKERCEGWSLEAEASPAFLIHGCSMHSANRLDLGLAQKLHAVMRWHVITIPIQSFGLWWDGK